MKAFFVDNIRRAIKLEHRRGGNLEGQMVIIDCDCKQEVVRVDLYKKGQKTYYCCLWVKQRELFVSENDKWIKKPALDVMGSGKADSRFDAIYAALESTGISFDRPLPEPEDYFDQEVWNKLEQFISAIAEAAGAENYYVHKCLRCN